jgi:superoxide dismutase, Fe-Mn family
MSDYQLPSLAYGYNDLEPVFSEEALKLHHDKHHRAYVNNFNAALVRYLESDIKKDATALVELQSLIKFNGGGYINHNLFFEMLLPINKGGGEVVKKELYKAIEKDFQSFEKFTEFFNNQTIAIQGSGWGWLGFNKQNRHLVIETTLNHGLLSEKGSIPIICVDVWEHAYYLKYKNNRSQYVKDIWKIFNWQEIERRFIAAIV